MSIESTYRVQCSGYCEKYLGTVHGRYKAMHYWEDGVQEYRTWAEANKRAAKAGWFDGSQGEYAECTCDRPLVRLPPDWRETHPHTEECRLMRPRLVPLCPECRDRYF